jgi:Tfp pilus assembly protein PilO
MPAAMSTRDRRALLLLSGAVVLFALLQFDVILPGGAGTMTAAPVAAVEEELLTAQVAARQRPLTDAELNAARATLENAEKRLLLSETAALASAEMREIVGKILEAEGIKMDASQFGRAELEGDHYTQIPLVVRFNCAIEQVVNLMAAIGNAGPLLTTRQVRISPSKSETKTVAVQITVAGYLPVSRTPELVKKKESR